MPLAQPAIADGEEVVAFARPHELDIVVDGERRQGLAVKVNRVLVSGAIARVELTGLIGANGHAEPQHFEVELTRERLAELGLQPGQPVRLTSSRLRVFPLARGGPIEACAPRGGVSALPCIGQHGRPHHRLGQRRRAQLDEAVGVVAQVAAAAHGDQRRVGLEQVGGVDELQARIALRDRTPWPR